MVDELARLSIVLGQGGLLGSHVAAEARRHGDKVLTPAQLAWSNPALLADQLSELFAEVDDLTRTGRRWQVLWCAGKGSVAATRDQLVPETRAIERVASGLRRLRPGTVSFSSSAGAMYAGVKRWPATESTQPVPTHPYGFAKQHQEAILAEACESAGHELHIHRISNVFGIDPKPLRTRGLIGHLVKNTLRRSPSNIFVPLSFSRDYLFASDAARLVLHQSARPAVGATRVHLVAAERNHTVLEVIQTLSRIMKRTIPFVEVPTAESGLQPPLLAFRSEDSQQRQLVRVSLAEGLRRLINHAGENR